MEEKDITNLLERYEQMLVSGKSMYFDADEYDDLAEYYDRLDDTETAKDIVNLGLNIHPNNEYLMLKYAKFLVYDAQYTDALDYLNTNFASYDFEQYLLKIECFLCLGLYAEAYDLTNQVLQNEDTDLDVVLSELGFLYLESEYLDEAILYLQKSLEYNPKNKDVLSDLVYAYEAKDNFDKAISICNNLLDIDPYSAEGWMLLGKLYSLIGDFEKAIDAFDFVSTIEGEDIPLLKLKAHCLVLAGRVSEAVDILLECLELSPSEEMLYMSLADCYMDLEQFDDVLKVISQYETLSGETAVSLSKKAYAYCMLSDNSKSLEFINKSLELDSLSFEVNVVAIELFSKLELFLEARNACERALFQKEDDLEILEKATILCVRLEEFELAISYQKRLLSLSPSVEASKKLALLFLENGDKLGFEECITSFDDNTLISFFSVFYMEEFAEMTLIERDHLISRLMDAYECRLLYKNIKY